MGELKYVYIKRGKEWEKHVSHTLRIQISYRHMGSEKIIFPKERGKHVSRTLRMPFCYCHMGSGKVMFPNERGICQEQVADYFFLLAELKKIVPDFFRTTPELLLLSIRV